jgi:hypothetical protein
MMPMRHLQVLGVAALALAFTACGGGGATTADFKGHACPAVFTIAQEFLIYPAPGSTGIPDSPPAIVVARPTSELVLQPAIGSPIVTSSPAAVPSPLPSPNAQHPGITVYSGFAVPPLTPATTYTVTGHDISTDPSCPGDYPQLLGSFTTQ